MAFVGGSKSVVFKKICFRDIDPDVVRYLLVILRRK